MTAIERKMQHFNANAPRCKPHGERPRITFDGIHVIECGKGCSMHDAEHAEPDALMLRWEKNRR